jgi:RNA polymerase sigma-70 factor (ECF subfamily)
LNDLELVQRIRSGDSLGWDLLVEQNQEAIFRLAYLILGQQDEAADVTQEAFIRAYRALDRFDADRPLRPWLLRIAANLARNRQRSVSRYLAALARSARLDPHFNVLPDVEGESTRRRAASDLWLAVQKLARPDQEVIYLRHFLSLPVEEAAEILEVAAGTVKSRLHRAHQRLRSVIENEFPALKEGGESE